MIDVVKRTPKIYRDESRDFQVLARLYTALFSVSKMYADDLRVWDPNIDNKLITLRSRTVNFINRHQWDLNDLEAITSCFKYLMRNKGTKFAIQACINILMKSRGIDTGISVDSVMLDSTGCINIWVVNDKIMTGIMEDLIRYLIPTGLIYRLYNYDLEVINAAKGIITDIYYRQDYIVKNYGEDEVTSEGAPSSLKIKFEDIKYPFNPAMLIQDFKGNYHYNIPPTSNNFGYYSPNITNTFVYDNSEGWMAVNFKNFTKPFVLYVAGRTLYCYPEENADGDIIGPVITYDSSNRSLIFNTTPPPIPHNPIVRPQAGQPGDSEGTLIWNEWGNEEG